MLRGIVPFQNEPRSPPSNPLRPVFSVTAFTPARAGVANPLLFSPGTGIIYWHLVNSMISSLVKIARKSLLLPSLSLTSLLATHPKNSPVTPFLATLPFSLDLKSFVCHTSAKERGSLPVSIESGYVCHPCPLHEPTGTFLLVRIALYNFQAPGLSTVNCERSTANLQQRSSPHESLWQTTKKDYE